MLKKEIEIIIIKFINYFPQAIPAGTDIIMLIGVTCIGLKRGIS